MTAETRRLLKQAIDAHVREQLEVSRVDFCTDCGAAVDIPRNRRAEVLCSECKGFSALRKEESWPSRIAGRLRIRTWTPGMTQKVR